MKKFSILAIFAIAMALIFTGCPKDADEEVTSTTYTLDGDSVIAYSDGTFEVKEDDTVVASGTYTQADDIITSTVKKEANNEGELEAVEEEYTIKFRVGENNRLTFIEDEEDSAKENLELDKDTDLGTGWSSSYNGATKTITYEGAYGGRGWWFGEKDASDFTSLTVVFSAATGPDPWLQLVIEYNEGENDSVDGVFDGDGFTLTKKLDEKRKSSLKQAYIQGKAEGNTATIKEAYFE